MRNINWISAILPILFIYYHEIQMASGDMMDFQTSENDGYRLLSRRKRAVASVYTSAEIQAILDKHNTLRKQEGAANMQLMKWNSDLASMGQEWADTCQYTHGQPSRTAPPYGGTLGQNLFLTTGTATPQDAIDAWYAEKSDYDFDTKACSAVCGHYTQVVWDCTWEVGCGETTCATLTNPNTGSTYNNALYIVCNYGPAGNMAGSSPYVKGETCTKCCTGYFWCDNGLCRDCPGDSITCPCKANCGNCGIQTPDCQCTCLPGRTGADCSELCEDKDAKCGANPGWPPFWCDAAHQFVIDACPAMCGVCAAAADPNDVCAQPDIEELELTEPSDRCRAADTGPSQRGNLTCDLDQQVCIYKTHALSYNTKRAYGSQLRMYLDFCDKTCISALPISQQNLACYFAYLAKTLSDNSVNEYVNVVRLLHLEAGFPNPLLNSSYLNPVCSPLL